MKKIITILVINIMCMLLCNNVFALTTLHETSESKIINSGTNLTTYKRLTDKGWLSINVIDIDLKDKNTSVGVLTSSNGLQTFQTVKTMVDESENCIAAINADFFNGNYKKGNAIGMTIKDGEMLSSTYYENEVKDVLASFVLTEDNEATFDYFTNKITLTNKRNNESISVSDINKWSSNYEYPVLYTSKWGDKSLGSSADLNLTELVIKNNKVVEVRVNEEAIDIPEDGYVISTLGHVAEIIQASFKKGDKVDLDIDVDLDIEKIKTAVSGGTFLVENGQIANFTHNIAGSNPRTAIGLSEDEETLYLITIDGRQQSSIGVTQAELAQILLEKGIYTAINLDGGGSTTMVVRKLGDESSSIQNSPSGGTLRYVPNSIAVFNTSKTSSLDSLLIEVSDVNVFVGCEKEFTVKGYDKYYNPVEIETSKIKWSYTGVPVSINNNILVAGNEAGSTVVTASIGKAKATITIDVLSQPNELTISPKKVTIGKGEGVTFKVSGQNKNGYFGNLKNNEVTWKIESGIGNLKEGVFTASNPGDYIISASAGNATSYALVTIDSSVAKIVNDFEKLNFEFKSYPDEVTGKVALATDEIYFGKTSARLDYDFTKTNKTRAAYLRFNENIILEKNAETIDFMFYSTVSTTDQVKAKIVDANNTTQYLVISKGLESIGWQEMKLDLSNIALPAKLIDIYIAQDNENALTSGTVYFDDLKITYKSTADNSTTVLPLDRKGVDTLNVVSELESNNAFRIVISPEMKTGILLEHLKNKKLENVINKNSEIVILPSQSNEEMLANVDKTKIISKGYNVLNYKAATIITLDISNGGLRATDSNQWTLLKADIKSANKNVILVMNGNIDDFEDADEKQLFIDVLCELKNITRKNIWVIQKGDNTDYSMKRGVKYLSIATKEYTNVTTQDIIDTNYILLTVNDSKMTYEIKNVYEK